MLSEVDLLKPWINHMKNKLHNIFSAFVIFAVFSLGFPPASQAQTSAWFGVCTGTGTVSQSGVSRSDVATVQGLQCLIANVLSVTLTAIGLAGFVMLIIGSFRWMLSGGSSQEVEKAGKTMTFAIVGLLVALSSFIILNLLAEFTGVRSILNFIIPASTTQWPTN